MFYYKEFVNSPEHSFMLLKTQALLPPSTATPPITNSSELSQEQTLKLYREIGQFCKPRTEDIIAPSP